MADVVSRVTELAVESGFSGVIRIDRAEREPWSAAFGLADRRHKIANDIDTQFGIASGVKSLTALVVVSLIEAGALSLDTAARDVLGDDLPLISDQVSIEHLLAHRSGIGDYLDEEAVVSPTTCSTFRCISLIGQRLIFRSWPTGRPSSLPVNASPAAAVTSLALIAGAVSGQSFQSLVEDGCVSRLACMTLRSCAPMLSQVARPSATSTPARVTDECVPLPVVGTGDGGIYHALRHAPLLGSVAGGPHCTPGLCR